MRASELLNKKLKTYAVKLKLQQPGYTTQDDTTVQARNPEMARRLLRQQYGDKHILVGQPRELR